MAAVTRVGAGVPLTVTVLQRGRRSMAAVTLGGRLSEVERIAWLQRSRRSMAAVTSGCAGGRPALYSALQRGRRSMAAVTCSSATTAR